MNKPVKAEDAATLSASQAVSRLRDLYRQAVAHLRADLHAYLNDRALPSKAARGAPQWFAPLLMRKFR